MVSSLDIFQFRDNVINDYRQYVESFLKIRDPQIQEYVTAELDQGRLWTDPLVQLNPSYRKGATVTELVAEGVLHPDCEKYFSRNGQPFQFHYHQEQAFRRAKSKEPYVLTTGTGSGKSMTYVVPIFDDILRHPTPNGVRAILVYPMNALVNSQEEELRKFVNQVPDSPIRFAKYTGQEDIEQKTELQNQPPHILLTNYVMLELMLTRSYEHIFITSPELNYLVLDELHTYRGRQGADVAILVRKLRQRSDREFLCIGTSATMSSGGNRMERRQVVSEVASKIFGVKIPVENVIDETLERSIPNPTPPQAELLRTAIMQGLPPESAQTKEAFLAHPLSAWLEMTFGLAEEDGHLIRRTPITLEKGAQQLAEITGCDLSECRHIIIQMFLWGSRVKGLAFRLHQFISQGGSVYTTIEPKEQRLLTLEGQYVTTEGRLLYPLVFCRECGQEYYLVRYSSTQNKLLPLLPNALDVEPEDLDSQEGYFTLDEPGLWSLEDTDKLPDSWFKVTKKYGRQLKREYERFQPKRLLVLPDGTVKEVGHDGMVGWFVPKPFKFCLNCGIVHEGRKNENTKLSRLSSEGRSTATTLLSVSTVSQLKNHPGINPQAAKILSFTDNRQDASLQAGHFNDFIQTSFLRSALHKALCDNGYLTYENLAQKVVEAMALPQEDYAKQPAHYGPGKKMNEEVFRQLIEYRLYEDLQRGWRIIQPNLEQTGLLEIDYEELPQICADLRPWQAQPNPLLLQATPAQREFVVRTLLDQLKRSLAIDAQMLQPGQQDELKQKVVQVLKEPWAFDPNERLKPACWASISEQDNPQKYIGLRLTSRSKIGRFLRSAQAWPWRSEPLSSDEYEKLISDLVTILADCGYLLKQDKEVQLRVTVMIWRSVDREYISPDPLLFKRLQGTNDTPMRVNQFFQDFYRRMGTQIHRFEGREHTGQVSNEKRQEREEMFRKGELSALFCSPTMELGIDIADLNVVHMRNVPPSPANYAQRSGRAGRSGQEALVITYATVGSGHDQYFFRRQEQMVAGVVKPPKIELGNPDLIRSHIYSVWLAMTGQNLQESMNQILDLEQPGYPIKDSVYQQLNLSPDQITHCVEAVQEILQDSFALADLEKMDWFSPNSNWIEQTVQNALKAFDQACNRWRELYRDADRQRRQAQEIINRAATGNVTNEERNKAEQQLREAQRQVDLLVGQKAGKERLSEFEFYPYRYFASEGFLPGYNFPRLPVRAYIDTGEKGEFIPRPRLVALREFAPGNIVYYEGNKFKINKTKMPVGGIEAEFIRMSLCFSCGYFHHGNFRDTCENCGAEIKPDCDMFPAKLNHVLPMMTMLTVRRERITCDEEERLKYGYNLKTHFRYDNTKRKSASVRVNDQEVLRLVYSDTAKICRLNGGFRKWHQGVGFKLSQTDGKWIEGDVENNATNIIPEVFLAIDDTANILVVEPIIPSDIEPHAQASYLTSLQYALEVAIEAVYKLEEDELASERLGDGKRILFWEAAEGGAGVLSQLLDDPDSFRVLAECALDICHFVQDKPSCVVACYECLLTYQNQFDHPLINRHLLHTTLTQLTHSVVEVHMDKMPRQQQYEMLLGMTDPNSPFEKEVLQAIFEAGMPLPDAAQELIPEANVKPDFVYKQAKIALFCDGSVHDHPEKKQADKIERQNLQYSTGYSVMVFTYNEDWRVQLEQLKAWL